MAENSPVLAYGLALKAHRDQTQNEAGLSELDLLRLGSMKQQELAELLGFPESKSAIKFLRRLDCRGLSPDVLQRLVAPPAAVPGFAQTGILC